MYIVAIAWIYVALMMSVAEATNTNGTVIGAIVTFILYGILPTSIIIDIMDAPRRRKARLALEREAFETSRVQTEQDTKAALPQQPEFEPQAKSETKP
jgi:hypothetical protein